MRATKTTEGIVNNLAAYVLQQTNWNCIFFRDNCIVHDNEK